MPSKPWWILAVLVRSVAIQAGQRTAVSDLDVDICLLEILGLELLPLHAANSSSLVKGHPAFKFVITHVWERTV